MPLVERPGAEVKRRPEMTRRRALGFACACGMSPFIGVSHGHAAELFEPPKLFDYGHPGKLSARAVRLVETSNVIDLLCDVRPVLEVRGGPNTPQMVPDRFMRWFRDPASITADELRRYRLSGVRIFYTGADTGQLVPGSDPFERAKIVFDGWRRIQAAHPDEIALVMTPDDLKIGAHEGKIKIILGLQNGDHFRSPDDVPFFYGLGQRISQLTYNKENALGGGAFSDVGLKPLGREVIHAMNRVGMTLDLSHACDATALDAAAATEVTPIISHTNCRALNPGFSRAVPDSVIKAFASKGGVIGVTIVRQFVSPSEPTTIEDYLNHIDHIAGLVGIDHVGIGCDTDMAQQDGADDAARKAALSAPGQEKYKWRERTEIDGLDHPRRIYDICEGLVRRGYSDDQIRLVLGGNWQRVLSQIWSRHI